MKDKGASRDCPLKAEPGAEPGAKPACPGTRCRAAAYPIRQRAPPKPTESVIAASGTAWSFSLRSGVVPAHGLGRTDQPGGQPRPRPPHPPPEAASVAGGPPEPLEPR